MTQQFVRPSSGGNTPSLTLPGQARGSLRSESPAGWPSETPRKETPIADGSVGGHVVGGGPLSNHGRARVGRRPQHLIACGASIQTVGLLSTAFPLQGGGDGQVGPLNAASARDGGPLCGLQPPAAGGGITFASPARASISQKQTAADVPVSG